MRGKESFHEGKHSAENQVLAAFHYWVAIEVSSWLGEYFLQVDAMVTRAAFYCVAAAILLINTGGSHLDAAFNEQKYWLSMGKSTEYLRPKLGGLMFAQVCLCAAAGILLLEAVVVLRSFCMRGGLPR